ncbi:pimeloyl-ACP methyl ester carboxylesterase [Duganella sp. 1224]|uniref:alpha/beta fold hydrolase n=1 Tax=Duganella sp. 1224 TaxID=2587052 RepID=UPI0015CBBF32|nr:alpha/beta hydrolase [Duganella sp. 1224]NYE62131.1 pimeloyl-ACP methyl ester carboxylesterase [Duganella sp. 1224]
MLIKTIAAFAATMIVGQAAAADHPAFKVDVTGAGAPIILIPGLASPGSVWDGTVAHYCASGKHQCHVLTLAGFAGQPAIQEPLLPAAERQLSAYIKDNKLDHPVVIGHSLGGYLGMKLAADHPDQVGQLVIVDSLPALGATQVPSLTRGQLKQQADVMRAGMKAQDAETFKANQMRTLRTMITKQEDIDRVIANSKQSDRDTVIDSMAELMAADLRDDISRIKAPTLVLGTWIAYKDYVPKQAIASIYTAQYAKLPGVRVEMAENARHFIMVDDPAWMYDRIDNFLN